MKKKFLKITIIAILLVMVYASVANALSFTATMTPSSTTVPESTEFTVSVKVANLDVGANGINSLSGYLQYDASIFEEITEASIEGLNAWSSTYNKDNQGKITLIKSSFVKTEEAVFQVTFKTKTGTSGKSGKIQFNNIVASNSANDITASDISITITVGEESAVDGNSVQANVTTNATTNTNTNTNKTNISINKNTSSNKTSSNTNKTTNTNTNTNTNKASGSTYVNSSNTSKENIPYTGTEDTVMLLMGVVIAIAIVFYIKFERINKEMK